MIQESQIEWHGRGCIKKIREKLLSTIAVGYGDCRQLVWDGSGAHAIKKCGNPYEVAGRAGARRRYRNMT